MLTVDYIVDEIRNYFGYPAVELDELTPEDIKNYILNRAFVRLSPHVSQMKEHYFKITDKESYFTAIIRFKTATDTYKKVTIKVDDPNENISNKKINITQDVSTLEYTITYDGNSVSGAILDQSLFESLLIQPDKIESIVALEIVDTNTKTIQTGSFVNASIYRLPDDLISVKEVIRALAHEYLDDIIYRSAWNKIIQMAHQGIGGITNWRLSLSYLEEIRENFAEFNQGYEFVKYPDLGAKGIKFYPTPVEGDWIYIRYNSKLIHIEDVPEHFQDWLIRYCISLSKERVGRIRSKFGTLSGPAGGITLDGNALLTEAQQELQVLDQELLDLDPMNSIVIM